mmetsp:Transcript_16684/g.37726  ORF Transcript_16684/g.37726 Transcript_16684/m.37726 type:complete len:123 (-) Transcript_16684:156-524(-)
MVPEVYFHPSDVGINQAGIAELAMQAVESLDPVLAPALLSNVLLVGGSSKFPGLAERFRTELRELSPADCEVKVWAEGPEAQKCAWRGGKGLVASGEYRSRAITKQEYQEHGADRVLAWKFY